MSDSPGIGLLFEATSPTTIRKIRRRWSQDSPEEEDGHKSYDAEAWEEEVKRRSGSAYVSPERRRQLRPHIQPPPPQSRGESNLCTPCRGRKGASPPPRGEEDSGI